MLLISHQEELLDMSASSQMMQLAMLETIRVLRGEVDEQEIDAQEEDDQEESESEEEEEDVAALYQRMNISRRMSLPANLTSLKHDDSQRRLQMLQRARGNFMEDDSQEEGEEEEEEEEEDREESLMCSSPPVARNTSSPGSDVGRRRRTGGTTTMPDVLSDESRSSRISTNPLPDLLPPQAPLPAALDCPDSCSVLYHPPNSILIQSSDAGLAQRVGPGNGWVGIAQGLNRLAGTATDKGFIDQKRRKSCLGSKLMTDEVTPSRKKTMRRRRSVAGTGWMENTRGVVGRSDDRPLVDHPAELVLLVRLAGVQAAKPVVYSAIYLAY